VAVGGRECRKRFRANCRSGCDIVLADYSPSSSNSHSLRNLHEENSHFKIMFIGMDDDPESFLKAILLGAIGYVLKDASALEIVAGDPPRGARRSNCPPTCAWC